MMHRLIFSAVAVSVGCSCWLKFEESSNNLTIQNSSTQPFWWSFFLPHMGTYHQGTSPASWTRAKLLCSAALARYTQDGPPGKAGLWASQLPWLAAAHWLAEKPWWKLEILSIPNWNVRACKSEKSGCQVQVMATLIWAFKNNCSTRR